MKKTLLVLAVLVLFLSAVVGLVFTFKLLQKTQTGLITEKQTISVPVWKEGLPIRKASARENTAVYFELDGKFVNGLKIDEERKDKALFGEFVLKGDILERKIPVYLGAAIGYTLLGTYENSFSGNAVWKMVENKTIPESIKANDDVEIVLDFNLPLYDYTSQVVDIMDKLLSEFSSNSFNYKIPDDFVLFANGVGMVKR